MNDVVVTAPNYASAQRSAQTLGIIAPVNDPPESIVALPEGHILKGTVTGQDAQGRLLVRTDFGVLAIQTNQKIAVGSQLMLEIRSAGPRVHVLILQVAAANPGEAQGTARANGPAAGPPAPVSGGLTPGPDSVSVGQNLRAVLQSPPASGAGLPPELARLGPGANIVLRITAVGVPSSDWSTPAARILGSADLVRRPEAIPDSASARLRDQARVLTGRLPAPGGASSSPGSAAAVAPAPAPSAPSGLELADALAKSGLKNAAAAQAAAPARGAGVLSGQASQTALTQPAAAGPPAASGPLVSQGPPSPRGPSPAGHMGAFPPSFTGLVTALTRTGEPILQTPLGTVSLDIRAAIPVGSSLAFQVLSLPAAGSAPATAQSPAPWHALSTFLAGLDTDPALRAALLQRAFPQAGPRLTSGLLLFLNALRGRSIEGWLGGYGSVLEQARRGGSLDRLRDGFNGLSRLVEGSGGEWRLFLIPFLQGGHPQPLRFYLRDRDQEDDGNGRQREPKATRFILDVELSRLGGLQLDGLVRPKAFDLVLRSDRPLSQTARQMVTEIFQTANGASGLTGGIAFQSTKDRQHFDVTGDPAGHHPTMTV